MRTINTNMKNINTTVSQSLFTRSKALVPGGVHSPVRSFKGLTLTPIFMERGEGAYLYDCDGNSYVDFCMSFGPLIFGHAHPIILEALQEGIKKGTSFGTCAPYCLKLVEKILEMVPFVENVRLVNSGTEAVMTAIRLARGYTGRDKILKFSGCYHGHVDSLLLEAGSGVAQIASFEETKPSSQGIPKGVTQDTLVCRLGDKQQVLKAFELYGNQIAAIFIEPLPANNGLLIQDWEFLAFLRDLTKESGALLVFDEVISGFRIGASGMAGHLNILPDLVTYGKIIGGGLPVGAIAGPKKILSKLSPEGGVYQAGTLSGNPLAMHSGLATLTLLNSNIYQQLQSTTFKICTLFNRWLKEYNNGQFSEFEFIHFSSLFWPTLNSSIKRAEDFAKDLPQKFAPLYEVLINKGVYLAPSAYEVGFVSMAHATEDVLKDLEKRLWN